MKNRSSINSLIAWLSVCVLAAAWGPSLGEDYRNTWTYFGLFGLVASLGLDVVMRDRRARRNRECQAEVAKAQQRRLQELDTLSRSARAIREAGHQLMEEAKLHPIEGDAPLARNEMAALGVRSESRTACWIPALLYPFMPHEFEDDAQPMTGANSPLDDGVPVFLRNVSLIGVGLCHRLEVTAPEAVLRVRLANGTWLSLLLSLSWHDTGDEDWQVSGWRLASVLQELRPERERSRALASCGAA